MTRTLLVLALVGTIPSAAESIADQLRRTETRLHKSTNDDSLATAQAELKTAIRQCELAPDPFCPQAYDWLGAVIESRTGSDLSVLRREVGPLYAKALELSNGSPLPLTLELHGFLLKRLGDPGSADPLALAAKARQDAIASTPDIAILAPGPRVPIQDMRKEPDLQRPSLAKRVEPDYPVIGKLLRQQGTVLLKVIIGTDGRAHRFELKRGMGLGFDEEAVRAVQKWVFRPGMKFGEPVLVEAQIEVNFKLI